MIISASHFLDLIKKKKKLSESIVPELIKRLIRETVSYSTYMHIPTNDDIFTPGFDGVIKGNTTSHKYLPEGDSLIEFGAKKDLSKAINKIDEDYQKRKKDASLKEKENYTYIAITTSILDATKKQAKIDEYTKENIFKNVMILDAVDITCWMEEHINICIWFLQNYGEEIDEYDICLISDEWNRISKATIPNISNSLFILGNESKSKKLIQDLIETNTNRIITISSEYYGRDYAFAFCVSSIVSSSHTGLIERSIVVNSQSGMNYVNAFCKEKIVLVNFNCLDDRFAATLNNTYIFFDTLFDSDIKLSMAQQSEFSKEVVKLGFSEAESSNISFLVDYNVLTLRRLLSKTPTIKVPLWSKNQNKNELIPLLLMGEINMENKGDLQFIKKIVGEDTDAYTEKLNLWSEMNQSPILKYDNVYKVCSRKECFDFLQIDTFSLKLKSVEEQLLLALSEVNKKHSQSDENPYIDDKSYIWGNRLIDNILNGFLILSEKSRKNQLHFDLFVEKLLNNVYGNYELALTLSQYFSKFSELSPSSYLTFLQKSITNDKDNFQKYINKTYSKIGIEFKYVTYILHSLENLLSNEHFALESFDILLDIYYLSDDEKLLIEEVIKYLSPISTMTGLIALPFTNKIDHFFYYIRNKDYEKTFKIVDILYKHDLNTISVGISHSYRMHEKKQIKVTYGEIFKMKSKSFNWLLENQKDSSELLQTLKHLLQNINSLPQDEFTNQLDKVEEKMFGENDEIKVKACRDILKTRENILRRSSSNNLDMYIAFLDTALKKIKPKDDYVLYKYILVDDYFPLQNPPTYVDSSYYTKIDQMREQVKRDVLTKMIKEQGQSIIEKIIQECTNNSTVIFPIIYELSDNHLRDFKLILEKEINNGLKIYLRLMDKNKQEINVILKNYVNNSFVIRNLPYSKRIYKWIDGKEKEKEYWENQYFDRRNADDFEYLFTKFINFAPRKLINFCAYFAEIDYEHSMRLLKALSLLIENTSANDLNYMEVDSIQEFIKKLDGKYYTDELSLCEFRLLSVLKSGIEDYPMGIKKYFWDNPDKLGGFLIQLYEQKDSLPPKSMGQKLLFDALVSYGRSCYIPSEYIIQKRQDIKPWVDRVLSASFNKKEDLVIFLKHAIVNTLAACPKQISENAWPIKEVADCLEYLSMEGYNDKYEVSSNFFSGYMNRRGMRDVNDGTLEFSLSEEFKKYQLHYQKSHPVTSRALEYISDDYYGEGENDRKRSLLGLE